MIPKFINFIKKPESKDVIINTSGNYLSVFFIALFALILVRILTPAQYGVLSVLLGIAYVLSNVLDFGTTATIYSYFPPMLEKKRSAAYRFIKSVFFYQSFFSVLVIVVLIIIFPYLDKVFFKTKAPVWELYLTSLSVLFFIWQNFVSNILFASKKFFKVAVFGNIANALKTVVILLMVFTKTVTIGSIIFVFGILGPIFFFLLLFLEKKDLIFVLLKSEIKKEEFRFSYTATFFLASQFFNLGLRMDLFLLSYFLSGKPEVGYYGLAQKIILTVITTTISITQVLSPRFSKIKTKDEALRYFKTGFVYLLLPAFLFLIIFFIPDWVYLLFFTKNFAVAASITRALALPFIVTTIGSLPYLFILYTMKKPIYILISNIIFFITMTIGCYFLIPQKGVFGPPIVLFFALLLPTIYQTIIVFKNLKNLPV